MKYHVVNRKTGAFIREVDLADGGHVVILYEDEELRTPDQPHNLAALHREWLAARRTIENIGILLERMGS